MLMELYRRGARDNILEKDIGISYTHLDLHERSCFVPELFSDLLDIFAKFILVPDEETAEKRLHGRASEGVGLQAFLSSKLRTIPASMDIVKRHRKTG